MRSVPYMGGQNKTTETRHETARLLKEKAEQQGWTSKEHMTKTTETRHETARLLKEKAEQQGWTSKEHIA
eukprot:1161165-Pelagomonas_calceolata.AAC.6